MALALVAGVFASGARAEIEVLGFVAARARSVDAPQSWTEHGLGRFLSDQSSLGGESRVQIEASSGLQWRAMLHLGGRVEESSIGRRAGLVEAFVERRWWGDQQRWQLRLGQAFLPLSRENIDPLWVSPYTLSHSAINSWIGEELRPLGADFSWRREFDDGDALELAASVFVGNDSSGALLAWRGFAWHDRVSYYDETLPLPALGSLSDPTQFAAQNDAGSKPFGADLDGRPGYALRVRWSGAVQRWMLSAVDNRGDLALHRGEYAWRTRFLLAGMDHNAGGEGWSYAAEILGGDSRMGIPNLPKAHIRFYSAYALASFGSEPWRLSIRFEGFEIDDIDRSAAENNDENGWALTFAILRRLDDWRLGVEYLYVDGHRPGAADDGFPLQTGGHQLLLEARYEF